jgi:hypothetical protein
VASDRAPVPRGSAGGDVEEDGETVGETVGVVLVPGGTVAELVPVGRYKKPARPTKA